MTMISEAKAIFAEWITAVTRAVDIAAERLVRTRRILLRELDDGSFVASATAGKNGAALPVTTFRLEAGGPRPPLSADWGAAFRVSLVEVVLEAVHVITHLLDFPTRATDFLDG